MDDLSNLSGVKLGNYRIERLIGRGRMGAVFLARDEALLRPTALKILSWQAKDCDGQNPEAWFIAEARSVARINHPNVVQIYGVARQGPHCYIAMEYIDGGSADAAVVKNGPFPPTRATEILLQTCEALQAAHKAGIVHRDVKPENLLIRADGTAKLGDFGMALQVSKPRPMEPARAGTPYYTAPEIWCAQAATPQSDLYALGATYYYLLTGRLPFEAEDLQTLILAHLHDPIPEACTLDARIPRGCDRIIRQCLAKSTEERFANAQTLGLEASNLLYFLGIEPPTQKCNSLRPLQTTKASGEHALLSSSNSCVVGAGREAVKVQPAGVSCAEELLLSQHANLVNWLEMDSPPTLVLLGECGSGRTTLAKKLLTHHANKGAAFYFDGTALQAVGCSLEHFEQPINMPVFSAGETTGNVKALLDWFKRVSPTLGMRALLVLDANIESLDWFTEHDNLMRRTSPSQHWKVLVIDVPARRERWMIISQANPTGAVSIQEVPRLTFQQSLRYVKKRVELVREINDRGWLVTPDAQLLIAYGGNGNVGRINRILQHLARQANDEQRLLVSSWDVWNISVDVKPDDFTPVMVNRGVRPATWPTKSVLDILNHCRKSCGVQPRR